MSNEPTVFDILGIVYTPELTQDDIYNAYVVKFQEVNATQDEQAIALVNQAYQSLAQWLAEQQNQAVSFGDQELKEEPPQEQSEIVEEKVVETINATVQFNNLEEIFTHVKEQLVVTPDADVSREMFAAEQYIQTHPNEADAWSQYLCDLLRDFPGVHFSPDINDLVKEIINDKAELSEIMVDKWEMHNDFSSIGILARKIVVAKDRIQAKTIGQVCAKLAELIAITDWHSAQALAEIAYATGEDYEIDTDRIELGKAFIILQPNDKQFWDRVLRFDVGEGEWGNIKTKQIVNNFIQRGKIKPEQLHFLEACTPDNVMAQVYKRFPKPTLPPPPPPVGTPPPPPSGEASPTPPPAPPVMPKKAPPPPPQPVTKAKDDSDTAPLVPKLVVPTVVPTEKLHKPTITQQPPIEQGAELDEEKKAVYAPWRYEHLERNKDNQ